MCDFVQEVAAILDEMDEIRRRTHEKGSGEHEVRQLNEAMVRVTGALRARLDHELEVRERDEGDEGDG